MNLTDLVIFYTNMIQFGIVKVELVGDKERIVGFQATYTDGSIIQHTFDAMIIKEPEEPNSGEKKEELPDVQT